MHECSYNECMSEVFVQMRLGGTTKLSVFDGHALRTLEASRLLIVADFSPEYDYVNKIQQAQ